MTREDLRLLCTALSFTAVVMQNGKAPREKSMSGDDELRIRALAALIEQFCLAQTASASKKHLDLINEMAGALELCLACEEGLTWAAEHDAQIILKRARQAVS